MSTWFAGRAVKLIAASFVALAAVMFIAGRGGPSQHTVDEAARQASSGLHDTRAAAQGASAEVLLRTASVAVDTLFAQQQTYDGITAALPAVEPGIAWVTSGPADATRNQVAVATGSDGYRLSTAIPGGPTYTYARDVGGTVTRSCAPECDW